MGKAIMKIDMEILASALGLPDRSEVMKMALEIDQFGQHKLKMVVSSDELQDSPPHERLPVVTARFERMDMPRSVTVFRGFDPVPGD